jgi:16S rRNA (guanine527-N7)-methyltransferase
MIASEEHARAYVAEFADPSAIDRLDRLVAMLREENECQNLVSAATLPDIWRRHVADSAQLLTFVPRGTGGTWLDLGTGAGFPGLVIAALAPALDVCLVESRRKRVKWLEYVRSELKLEHCRVIGKRLELIESFPVRVISARAFAPLPQLLELSGRFSTAGTLWLLPKGQSAAQELAELPESTRRLFHVEKSRTHSEAGIIVGRLAPPRSEKVMRSA